MKRLFAAMIALAAALMATAIAETGVVFTDATGREVAVHNPQRVIALYGTYGKVWLEAGGDLLAIPEDAMETPLVAGTDIENIGSHKLPDMERLFMLAPDFVILSADITEHAAIGETLAQAGIPHAYFSNRSWQDYMQMFRLFAGLTGNEDLCGEMEQRVQKPIEDILAQAADDEDFGKRTALLLRVAASNVKSKDSDSTIAGVMLRDMGFVNIADSERSILENLTMEAILMADPDWIFAVPQGSDTEAALDSLRRTLTDNPAWATLSAVREDRFVILPKALFHQHPNADWAEAYLLLQSLLEP